MLQDINKFEYHGLAKSPSVMHDDDGMPDVNTLTNQLKTFYSIYKMPTPPQRKKAQQCFFQGFTCV